MIKKTNKRLNITLDENNFNLLTALALEGHTTKSEIVKTGIGLYYAVATSEIKIEPTSTKGK